MKAKRKISNRNETILIQIEMKGTFQIEKKTCQIETKKVSNRMKKKKEIINDLHRKRELYETQTEISLHKGNAPKKKSKKTKLN